MKKSKLSTIFNDLFHRRWSANSQSFVAVSLFQLLESCANGLGDDCMITNRQMDKNTVFRASFVPLALWLLIAGRLCADQALLLVDRVPQHGLVTGQVDLTPAVRIARPDPVQPAQITATDRQGNPIPFQFIPDADFDSQKRLTGFIITRLSPNKRSELKLEFGSEPEPPIGLESIETSCYTIFHDPKRGGLPTKIVFRETGKVFDNFRWQDRVHHRELGGFTLQNDKAASVECLTTGPL